MWRQATKVSMVVFFQRPAESREVDGGPDASTVSSRMPRRRFGLSPSLVDNTLLLSTEQAELSSQFLEMGRASVIYDPTNTMVIPPSYQAFVVSRAEWLGEKVLCFMVDVRPVCQR